MPAGFLTLGRATGSNILHRAFKRSFIVAAALWPCFIGPSQACDTANCSVTTASQAVAANEEALGKPLVLTDTVKRRPKRTKKAVRRHRSERATSKKTASKKTASGKPAQQDSAEAATKEPSSKPDKTVTRAAKPADEKLSQASFAKQTSFAKKATDPSALAPDIANARAEFTPNNGLEADAANAPRQKTAKDGVQIATADQFNDLDRAMTAETPAPVLPVQGTLVSDNQPAASQSVSNQDDPWDRASLIGKIFIALGAMLTLASAARMFIA